MKAQLITGGVVQIPTNVDYVEVDDQTTRASIIAHLIRIGERPPLGRVIGFSQQIREGEVADVVSASGAIDHTKAPAITPKVWYQITVNQADINAAHALINSQQLSYREKKTSQIIEE